MEHRELSIGYCQMDPVWIDREKNLRLADEMMDRFEKTPDIILLPETFTTGFYMKPEEIAESMQGETVRWMSAEAAKRGALIVGSAIIEESGRYYNRMLCAFPDGKIEYYDKKHLFSYSTEDKHFTAGTRRLVIEYRGWRILPLVCYDLRFPVWSRNRDDFELMLYVANWPVARMRAWDTLLAARAIENLCYVAAVNRVGIDGNQLRYAGGSGIYDFTGNCIHRATDSQECFSGKISMQELEDFRKQYNFLADRDRFSLEI